MRALGQPQRWARWEWSSSIYHPRPCQTWHGVPTCESRPCVSAGGRAGDPARHHRTTQGQAPAARRFPGTGCQSTAAWPSCKLQSWGFRHRKPALEQSHGASFFPFKWALRSCFPWPVSPPSTYPEWSTFRKGQSQPRRVQACESLFGGASPPPV